MSALPNARAGEKMAEVNILLAAMANKYHVHYLEPAAAFTPVGNNWKGLSRDKLHLSAEGDAMWAAELKALLPALLGITPPVKIVAMR